MRSYREHLTSILGASRARASLLCRRWRRPRRRAPKKDAERADHRQRTPEQQSRVRKLLSRLFGKAKTEKLEEPGSEVVTVPKEQVGAGSRSGWSGSAPR